MSDKKGLNFIIGVGILFLLFRLYSSGFLHDIGFMAINNVTGQELSYSYQDGQKVYSTPIADLASVVVDLVTVLGGLLVVLLTGLWELLQVLFKYLGDLFKILKVYIDNYMEKNKKEIVDDKIVDDKVVEKKVDPLLEILKVIKSLQDRQDAIESELKNKVQKTEIVKEDTNV